VAAAALLSFVLIVVSCFLAAWLVLGEIVPSTADVRSELAGNWLLVTFGLCAFAAISHALNLSQRRPASTPARITVKSRGRVDHLDLASIEWIESQGNYLALHVGGRSHLIRETLQNFAGRLDPERFVRVHRRVIVAIDRIRELQPLTNGDSTLILHDGRAIRASRSYRHRLPKGLPRTAS
jgi:DNA-binding LytR/AlgR family response regulator